MGSMAAWQLARRGHGVTIYDQHFPPHDHGAHSAESRIFRLAYKEGREYIPLLTVARSLWRELAQTTPATLFTQCGCLYIGEPGAGWLQDTIDGAQDAALDVEILDDRALADRFPQHRLYGGETALLDRGGALLRPELAVRAALAAAQDQGARVKFGVRVCAVTPDGDGVVVRAQSGADSAATATRHDRAIVTTGAWVPPEGPGAPIVRPRRLPGTWFAPDVPTDFVPHRFPVCIRRYDEIEYSGFPCVDGWTVKIMPPASTVDRESVGVVDRGIRAADEAYTSRVVRELLLGIAPHPVRTGVYIDGFTSSGQPEIVYWDDARRIVSATGFSGHGFKMAPAIGYALSCLVEGLRPDLPFLPEADPA